MLLTITTPHRSTIWREARLRCRRLPIGRLDEVIGTPTQMAVFERAGVAHG